MPSVCGKVLHTIPLLALALLGGLASMAIAQAPSASGQNNSNNDAGKIEAHTSPVDPQSPTTSDRSLQLGEGDLIELTVYDVPELTTKTRISSAGDINC